MRVFFYVGQLNEVFNIALSIIIILFLFLQNVSYCQNAGTSQQSIKQTTLHRSPAQQQPAALRVRSAVEGALSAASKTEVRREWKGG